MAHPLNGLRARLSSSSAGFTLPETLVGLTITVLATAFIGGAIFQALGTQRGWSDEVVATRELRNAASWFAGDAVNAQTALSGSPPVTPDNSPDVTMQWTDEESVTHTVVYQVIGGLLVRQFDGGEVTLARDVSSVSFSRSGQSLTFDLAVIGAYGELETTDVTVYARVLQ